MRKIKALFQKYREIIMYIFFGGLTTLVSWGGQAVFEWILRPFVADDTLCAGIATVLSWIVAVLFAFFMNKLFVFESKSFEPKVFFKELGLFVGTRIATGPIEWLGVPLMMTLGLNQELFGSKGLYARMIASVIVVIINYILGKFMVFRKKKELLSDDSEPADNAVKTAADGDPTGNG